MIVTLINQKGGVCKTTNTIHLGARLAQLKNRVLLIDLDPQCDLSHGSGVRSNSYDVIDFFESKEGFRLKRRSDNYFILPGNVDFVASTYKRNHLKELLEPLKDHFDYIFLDCPPTHINPKVLSAAEMALIACDYFLIPILATEFALKNANPFLGSAFKIKDKHNPNLRFLGFLFSMVLVTSNKKKKYEDLIKEHTTDLLFDSFIRKDTEIENAIALGKTIFQHKPNCRASLDYIEFTDEFLKRINNG